MGQLHIKGTANLRLTFNIDFTMEQACQFFGDRPIPNRCPQLEFSEFAERSKGMNNFSKSSSVMPIPVS
jgi:hypothetical protein